MQTKTSIELSIIIPVYNEQNIISELYERLKTSALKVSSNYELIFVNDCSKDTTLQLLMSISKIDNKVKYISFSRNFGHQIAVSAGLDFCSGDVVVIIDGDLQDPPELIPILYKKYKEGYDVVYARRTSRKGETLFKKISAKWFYRILKQITSIDIPFDTGDFRLIDKKIVELLKIMPEKNKFLRGQIAWLGFKQTFVEFERDKRKFGKTGYSLKKMITFALDGITAFSDKPLKLVTYSGFSVSFLAFLIILYSFYSFYFLNQTIPGWTSLMISTMFIGGIQLISVGIIGEYISRINDNVRQRPLYVIEETNVES